MENPPLGDIYDRPLALQRVTPDPETGPIARNQNFALDFNRYLAADELNFFSSVSVTSGGVRVSEVTQYRMVDKRILVRLRSNMEPGLFYDVAPNPDRLRSVTDQPYAGPPAVKFLVEDRQLERNPFAEDDPPPTWADVEPIFERCNVCHLDPEWKLPAMTPDGMIGQPSAQDSSRLIIRPFDAPNSYLMHKILWDYPIRQGTAQPPSWAGYEQLSANAQRLIERWIRVGAPR